MSRAVKVGCTLVVLAFVTSAIAQEGLVQRSKVKPVRGNTVAILNQVMPDVTFQDTPLETVMNWLGDITGLNIVPHWQTLEDAGLKKEKQISIQAHNLRLTQVLRRMAAVDPANSQHLQDMAAVCCRRGDVRGAAAHLELYLHRSPHARDSKVVRRNLRQLKAALLALN